MEHPLQIRPPSAFGNLTFRKNTGSDRVGARPYRVKLSDLNNHGTLTGISSQMCIALAQDDGGGQGRAGSVG
jgi:hypothetical protein